MKCEICNQALLSNRALLSHLKAEHATDPKEYFTKHPNALKFCSKCKKALPITTFLSDKSNNYGYRTACIDCFKPGRTTKKCPLCDRVFQWSAVVTHIRESHEISSEIAYKKYLKEKLCPKCGKVKDLNSFARSQNPDAPYFSWCTDCNVDRNMKRVLADADFDTIQYLVIRLSFSDQCFVCGMTHEESLEQFGQALHVDHITPHSKGGVLTVENSVLLCRSCNVSKMTRSLEEFIESRGESSKEIRIRRKKLERRHEFAKSELARISHRIYRDSIAVSQDD